MTHSCIHIHAALHTHTHIHIHIHTRTYERYRDGDRETKRPTHHILHFRFFVLDLATHCFFARFCFPSFFAASGAIVQPIRAGCNQRINVLLCATYECVMSHTSCAPHMNESCHISISHVTYECNYRINVFLCATYECVMSRIHESCHI